MTTTHSHCNHENTKAARAICRKERATRPVFPGMDVMLGDRLVTVINVREDSLIEVAEDHDYDNSMIVERLQLRLI